MKPTHRLAVLMLGVPLIALGIVLPPKESAQAARSDLSTEDRIKATLEDASRLLGGGFVLDPTVYYYEARPPKVVGINNVDYPVELTEFLAISVKGGDFCNPAEWQPYSFHGMRGCTILNGGHIEEVWWSPSGLGRDSLTLVVGTVLGYGCSDWDEESAAKAGCDSIGALPLAEALHRAAIDNGLYEPIPEETLPNSPSKTVPGQPESSIDQAVPANTDGSSGIPMAVILGSVGIPVVGAFAGAVLSTLLSGLSSAGATQVGESLAAGADEFVIKPAGPSLARPPAPQEPTAAGEATSSMPRPGSPDAPSSPPDETPSPAPPASPPTAGKHLWDLASNFAGNGSTVVGTLSEFFDFQDSAETIRRVQQAMNDWHNNPTKEAADNYIKSLGKTVNVRLKNLSTTLGNMSMIMDGVDAVRAGLNRAAARAYTGDDKLLAIGAEYSKKVLNYALTSNPVVGLVNTAVGGATQLSFGAKGRIDIGSLIDKGSDLWDATTQEYAAYTGGSYLPGDYAKELARDPNIQRKDQYLLGIRRIKKLIEQGRMTREEGCAQIRALQSIMGGE
jgi:hypothetical protein